MQSELRSYIIPLRRLAFGSYNDREPYHGWIFAYAQISLSLTSIFCVTPNGAVRGGQL